MIEINLKNRAISQTALPFNSMCKFGDVYIGATSEGLFKLDGYNDDGAEIPALIRSGMFDLGTSNDKRFAYFHLGLEATGDMEMEIFCDGVSSYTAEIPYQEDGRRNVLVKIPKGLSARYWAFELRNVDGAFFVLHSVKIVPITLLSAR